MNIIFVYLIKKNSKVSVWYTLFNTRFFFCFFSFLSLNSISWRFFHISTKRTSSFFFTAAHIRKNFLTIRACFKIELCHWEHSGKEQTGMMELRSMCQRGSQARMRLLFFQLRFPDPVCQVVHRIKEPLKKLQKQHCCSVSLTGFRPGGQPALGWVRLQRAEWAISKPRASQSRSWLIL